MAGQVIGKIPEFTGEESVTSAEEETKLPKAEEGAAPSSGAESRAETPPEKQGEKNGKEGTAPHGGASLADK